MTYCANHPDAAVTAFCQNCGKGLCSACARTVQGNVYCEPCLAVRAPGAPVGSGAFPPGGSAGPGMPGPYGPGIPPPGSPNPGTATLLGFIPGVGAMYNGQYIKAIVHVLVFVVLVGMVDRFWFFGLLIGFWVLYQVFDAHQTAKARRDGLPLPDPFGLNELGNRIGGHTGPVPPHVPPAGAPPSGTPPPGAAGVTGGNVANPYGDWAEQVRQQAHQWGEQAGQWGEQFRARVVAESQAQAYSQTGQAQWGVPPVPPVPPPSGWAAPPPPPAGWTQPGWAPPGAVPPGAMPPPIPPDLERARREPIGAIVLIVLGMLFLFNTLGFFSFGWISHGWPLIIVAIAVWLLMRNNPARFGFAGRFGHHPAAPPPDPGKSSADANQPGGGQ
jgi:hypothetical protein